MPARVNPDGDRRTHGGPDPGPPGASRPGDDSGPRTVPAGELPHATRVREDWIGLSDGCRLFARAILPVDAEQRPVPAVLEYLPYRLSDGTAYGDARHHGYFAGHGYASVRVDIRGTGNSDGILLDEYLPSEQLDACEVIEWLAAQPWCSGAVGMYGKSWGGFNGLQVAARRPPALRAVISAYFTDDRYADDVHYMGGCLLAHEALPWASYMLGINALPPDPETVGARWREMWLERLRETPFFLEGWLAHQRRDDFWRQGSICEDYGAVRAPVLLVGGFGDGYTNAVARTLEGLTAAGVPCRALLGPWSHGWPQECEPGPRIGFLQECVRWWDRWLRDEPDGALDRPALTAWMHEYDPPAPRRPQRSGRWITEPTWPPAQERSLVLFPGAGGGLAADAADPAAEALVGSELAGADCGAWCPYGEPTDYPPDQRAEDGLSLAYTTAPLSERVEVLGYPVAELELVVDRPLALVAVRLCDVAPDGSSLLVARGLLNLAHRESHADPSPMPVGAPTRVGVRLGMTGHAFDAGHRVRVAVSPTYWPYAWPSPEPVRLELRLGGSTRLTLPVRPARAGGEEVAPFGEPERAAPPPGQVEHSSWRRACREMAPEQGVVEVGGEERTRLEDSSLEFGERVRRRFALEAGRPLSARVEHVGEHFLARGSWRIRIEARTSLTATAETFVITEELDAYESGVRVHARRKVTELPRDLL